jgi:CHASE2 domain-containing sensor protein
MYVARWHTPLRPIAALLLFATAPGLAIVRPLRLRDPFLNAGLVVATSAAVTIFVAQLMLWAHWWSPVTAVAFVVAVAATGAAVPEPR